jgi:hypothetical protein
MILVLDSSLLDGIEKNSQVIVALELIAHSRRLGNHIVFGSRAVIKYLAKCPLLGHSSRAVYGKLYEDLPTSKEYLTKIKFSVEIVLENVLESITRGDHTIIRASVNYFNDVSIIDKTILLCEDLDDATFYERLAKACLTWERLGNITISYDPRNGGGQNTAKEYSFLQSKSDKFCLCLVDSDRKAPNLDIGDTAKQVRKVDDESLPLCHYFILGVRELENLIPTSIYKETFGHDPNKKNSIEFLERLDNSLFSNARKYIDIKDGLKLQKILKEDQKKEFRLYWIDFARKFRFGVSEDCINRESCAYPDNCQCHVNLALGKKVINEIENKYSTADISQMILDEDLKQEWKVIGFKIISWCCASSPMSSVGS